MHKNAPFTSLLLLLIGVVTRLVPHPANFTAVGAIGLFGGATVPKPFNYLLPLAVMFITDIFLGMHSTIWFVYASIILTSYIGEKVIINGTFGRKLTGSVLSATVFFIVTNFGVWLTTGMYAKTFYGLVQCYIAGVPFFRNMLLADIIFTFAFFAIYNYLKENRGLEKLDIALLQKLKLT